MPLSTYTNAQSSSNSPQAASLAALGTQLIVANTNGAALNVGSPGDPIDAQAVIDETAANHGNVRPIKVPQNCLYCNVYHIWTGGPITTDPQVAVMGLVRAAGGVPNEASQMRYTPFDANATFADQAIWLQLQDADVSADLLTLTGVAAQNGNWQTSRRRTVYLQGALEILVGVSVVSAGGTASMIAVQFSG